ncbi:MarR family winged helix-turn-helix transcriptional regulator [Mucilaginibacter lappiensis]|uniref:DNA-binding MarR family transcriptional regulator n=1 Tax=Mucilaginibacter lappiensis TaxID=354630 RepID=A0A1N7G7C9_9SPHI|nr:MarR family winged helix-turn-helix transcriptional regulator [Mucilaginibacter lappiensis]MBB6112824.1 DNA-binding MarR family transcriptional regulator [Mucilaginibacter lappiensis]MBB6129000.1 DNA-binding MarR family transcriptional regulator [Mucilaginibacter lappiensis]SIS08482.1 DNA-binding transcriptional regulator, MarR family [Mucilaginibacter lappiensis]
MNLYQNLGYLVLGSRLRRLSEAFLAEINRAYQNEGIDFDASWFPVFYLLSKNEALSIKELSEQIEVSHPAASQLITNLKNRKLVTSATCTDDGRRQLVTLTESGRELLATILPMWDAISTAMTELVESDELAKQLLPAITGLETAFRQANLAEVISQKLITDLKPTHHE